MARMWIELQKNVYSPGEEISGVVHTSIDKSISQRGASVRVVGKERTEISYQRAVQAGTTQRMETQNATQESEFLHQENQIPCPTDEKGKCQIGDHSAPFKFMLQQGLPGTYQGRHARIQYLIAAKIDVPMGMDVNAQSEFTVVALSPQSFQSAPINAFSNSWGNAQSPGISFTTDKGQYGRGEVINGRCQFRNPSQKDLRKIDIALKWIEAATAQNQRTSTEILTQFSQAPAGGRVFQGEAAFSINVPPQAPPTYEATLSNVRCVLTASLDVAMGFDVAASQAIRIIGGTGYGAQPAPQYAPAPQYPYGQAQPASTFTAQPYQPPSYPPPPAAAARCPRCGAPITKPGAQYCPACGSKL